MTFTEPVQPKNGIGASLAAGVKTLSLSDQVNFVQYVRMVLPLDGYVFWVRSSNTTAIKGSLHYSTQQIQNESETEGMSIVTFTALSPVQAFNNIAPNTLWIGTYNGDNENYDGPINFAFSQRGRYYKSADLFHYVGVAVLPALSAQLLNSADEITTAVPVVSNSLPIWLSLNTYVPPYPGFTTGLTLYPSFVLPDNLEPPYGAVHIMPEQTESYQAAPWFGPTTSQSSLSHDKLRITLYGLTNDLALTFIDAVLQFSYDYNTLGIQNMPVIRDEKRTAPELAVIAMKKTIEFEVSYNQQTARNVARQMITKCVNQYLPQPLTAVGFMPPAP